MNELNSLGLMFSSFCWARNTLLQHFLKSDPGEKAWHDFQSLDYELKSFDNYIQEKKVERTTMNVSLKLLISDSLDLSRMVGVLTALTQRNGDTLEGDKEEFEQLGKEYKSLYNQFIKEIIDGANDRHRENTEYLERTGQTASPGKERLKLKEQSEPTKNEQ